MSEQTPRFHRPGARAAMLSLVCAIGFLTAARLGIAAARTFTLQVARHAPVTSAGGGTTRAAIVVTAGGFAVYELSGDGRRDPKCSRANGCFNVWPPATTRSARTLSKAPGITGKLGIWRRGRILQLTLAGHPLYMFAGDSHKREAAGDGIRSFNGTWHVVRPTASIPNQTSSSSTSMTTTATSPTTGSTTSTGSGTTTTTTASCAYAPCY
jgi:predicted lipoprotein with Yx(FWY)xxD motif